MLASFNESLRLMRRTRSLVICAMLTAMQIALSLVASVNIGPTIRVSFGYLALASVGALLGPACALISGAVADILAFLIKPSGPYFPGFTLSAAITGAVYGFFFYRRAVGWRLALLAQAVVAVSIHLLLNSVWLKVLYGKAFWALLPSRALKNLIQLPVDVLLLTPMLALVRRLPIELKY